MTQRSICPILTMSRDDLMSIQQQTDLAPQVSLGRIEEVWQQLNRRLKPEIDYAGFEDGHIEAAAALGTGVDDYLAELQDSGQMLDALIADRLCMRLLSKLYQVLEDQENRSGKVRYQYAFPEDITVIGSILDHTGTRIRQTDAGMMKPVKSAAYMLIPGKGTDQDKCGGICAGCSRQDCPYAQQKQKDTLGALKYSYGYQRIFGTMPKDERKQKT